jgi:hypothetical protein
MKGNCTVYIEYKFGTWVWDAGMKQRAFPPNSINLFFLSVGMQYVFLMAKKLFSNM